MRWLAMRSPICSPTPPIARCSPPRRRRGDRTLSNAEQLTWLLAAIATAVSLQRAWNIVAKTTMQAPDKA